jgi:hypothetical protein
MPPEQSPSVVVLASIFYPFVARLHRSQFSTATLVAMMERPFCLWNYNLS